MISAYGSYEFDDNATIVASKENVMLSSGGQMYARKLAHTVSGYLSASGQAAISTAMTALRAALAKPYQDFVFRTDAGSNSATTLLNSTSISGVRVVDGPNFSESRGAEYATMRHFEFTVEAEYPLDNTNNIILEFSESISFFGGGPKYVVKDAVIGPAQKQRTRVSTAYYATQQGTAVWYRRQNPVPPAPRWPNDLLEAPRVTPVSPMRYGKGFQGYRISWVYNFGSVNPLIGLPTAWPAG